MAQFYPLFFTPIFKERIWGGRRLTRWFTDVPEGPIGEAWVLGDHPEGRTPIRNGLYQGETLDSLQQRFGADLIGTRGMAQKIGRFPLLFKLLDAQEDLSIQVHPSDDYAGLPPGELGKTEMWVVLAAEPGAKAVYGLEEGVNREAFEAAVREGRTMDVMNQIEVKAGDILYVPAGTIHALGAGLLVAEIQQSSDTTYRVYDYNRPGLDGKPRDLHVRQSLDVAQYGKPPEPLHPTPPSPNAWQEIVRSPFFVVSQGHCAGEWAQETSPESCHILMILDGTGSIRWDGGREWLCAGQTLLVPAALGSYTLGGNLSTLLVTIP